MGGRGKRWVNLAVLWQASKEEMCSMSHYRAGSWAVCVLRDLQELQGRSSDKTADVRRNYTPGTWAHSICKSQFLILYTNKSMQCFLTEMADSRAGQNELWVSCVVKE